MNKGALMWLKSYKFSALGLSETDDVEGHFDPVEYFRVFMAPAAFLVSGLTAKEFDFEKASKGDTAAQQYLTSELKLVCPPNTVISFFNGLGIGYSWMYILRDFCDYMQPAETEADVTPNLRAAWTLFMSSHELRYCVTDSSGVDVPVLINVVSGKAPEDFPAEHILYSKSLRAGMGTTILRDATNKPYYKLNEAELDLLQQALDIGIGPKADAKRVPVPMVVEGAVVHKDVAWFDADKPPKDVINLFAALPKSLVDECGDEIRAVIAMVNEGSVVSDEVRRYVDVVSKSLITDYDEKDLSELIHTSQFVSVPTTDVSKTIEEMGYQTVDYAVVTENFCTEYGIDKEITVKQLLDFYAASDDSPVPTPVVKEVIIEKEVPVTVYEDAVFEFVDLFEKVGSYLLHEVRTSISEDGSYESRLELTDILNLYFRLMMGDTENDLGDIVGVFKERADKAKPASKRIIEEAIRLLQPD